MDVPDNSEAGSAPTSAEIAAYVGGSADSALRRRVAAAALMDAAVRERIALLRAAEAAPADTAPIPAERRERLRERMLAGTRAVADEVAAQGRLTALPRGGGLWRVAAETWEAILRSVADRTRPLGTGDQALSLPCLAPAAAASGALEVQRETVTTPEGVRIEFQQLPGAMTRLRLIVDASALRDLPAGEPAPPPFNAAFVRLEEDEAGSPNRHILVVALNPAGRGYTDFVLGPSRAGAPDDPFVMPAPRGACRLAGATLGHLPPAPPPESA